MRREQLMREIAELDQEINRVLGSTELPKLESKPFPVGTWILALAGFAWYYMGGDYFPDYHSGSAVYVFWAAVILAVLAGISTVSWLFRKRGGNSAEYRAATEKVKVLQERRRELQMELKEYGE